MGAFYPEWPKIVRIAVTNPPSTTGYQVKVEIPWQPGMNDDFSDLRFTDYLMTLPYWIETSTSRTTATVWIKLTETGQAATEFFCYYGNNAAVSESSGTTVFEFFDDFPGTTLNTTNWTVLSGTPTVSGGVLNTGKNKEVLAKFSYSNTYAMRTRVVSQATNGQSAFIGFFLTAGRASQTYRLYGNYPTANVVNALMTGDTGFTMGNDGTTPHVYDLLRSGTQCEMVSDGVSKGTLTGGSSAVNYIVLGGDSASSTALMSTDWVVIRKYTTTDPTCTPAESGINTAFYMITFLLRYLKGITLTAVQHLTHIDLSWYKY